MQNKIIPFVRDMAFSLFMVAFGFGMLYWFSSSLHVTCELQSDETYTCVAQDELFGFGPLKVQADNVIGIDWELKCSGGGTKRGCAYVPQFQTATGEKVELSNLFTSNEKKVEELVQTIDSQMKEKSPSIDYTGKTSLLLGGSIFFCLAPILLYIPFLKLRPDKKGEGAKVFSITWGKKEK